MREVVKGYKMYKDINIDKLRNDLIDYFGTAMFNASPLAIMDLSKVKKANNKELIEIAIKNNFDLNKYKIDERYR